MSTPSVVIVDDHAIFRAGVKAELGEGVELLGEAESVEDAACHRRAGARRGAARRTCPAAAGSRIEQVAKQRPHQRFSPSRSPTTRRCDRHRPRRSPRYVTKTITGEELADAIRRSATATRSSTATGGFVLDARRRPARRGGRPGARPAHRPRARGPPLHRPRLSLQGDRPASPHLGEDSGGPRQLRAAKAATVKPP